MSAFEAESSLDAVTSVTPVREVVIDALAVLRIVKHCDGSLPTMVAGSLLGLDMDGILEITYSYAFPVPRTDAEAAAEGVEDLDGAEFQFEMMKMLRDVNVDNNCVGWYQSMYMGTMCTQDAVQYQYSYQSAEELSDNSVVIMYDPIQSRKGSLVIKAFRLSDKFMELKQNRSNKFIKPQEILEELPLKIRSQGHVSGFLRCLQDSHKNELDCDFDALSMTGTESYTEKHLELLGSWIDDLITEQQRFQQYSKATAKLRQEHIRWLNKRLQENKDAREEGEYERSTKIRDSGLKPMPEGPSRYEHSLTLGQLDRYCAQLNEHVDTSMHKALLATQLNSAP